MPLFLILEEPDLSTTLVFVFLFCVLMFVGGLSFKIVGGILAAVIPLGGLFLWYVTQPFQVLFRRIPADTYYDIFKPVGVFADNLCTAVQLCNGDRLRYAYRQGP